MPASDHLCHRLTPCGSSCRNSPSAVGAGEPSRGRRSRDPDAGPCWPPPVPPALAVPPTRRRSSAHYTNSAAGNAGQRHVGAEKIQPGAPSNSGGAGDGTQAASVASRVVWEWAAAAASGTTAPRLPHGCGCFVTRVERAHDPTAPVRTMCLMPLDRFMFVRIDAPVSGRCWPVLRWQDSHDPFLHEGMRCPPS
jgi:hypothetical protein